PAPARGTPDPGAGAPRGGPRRSRGTRRCRRRGPGAGRGSGAKLNASTYLRRGRLTVKMAVAGSAASHAAAVAVGQPRLLRVHLMTAVRRLAPDCDLPLPARTHEALR